MEKLVEKLNLLDLTLLKHNDTLYSVNRKDIANPLLFFCIENKGDDYNGTINVKSINIDLFTPTQVAGAIRAVNSYLITS